MKPFSLRRIATGIACVLLAVLAWRVGALDPRSAGAVRTTGTAHQPLMPDRIVSKTTSAVGRPAGPASAPIAHGQDQVEADPRVQQCHKDFAAAIKARAAGLARTSDPRARAVAALLDQDDAVTAEAHAQQMKQRWQALSAAAERAPDDALLAWLDATHCRREDQCDERAATDRLLRAEPDNAAVWLLAVSRAMERNDEPAADAWLKQAARAPRLDFHWNDLGLLVVDAMSGLSVPSCEAVPHLLGQAMGVDGTVTPDDMVAIYAVASTSAMPLHLGAHRLCPSRGSIPAARLPACRAVFARMAEGDELVSQSLGASRMLAWAETPGERAEWRERRRNLMWLQQEVAKHWRPGQTRLIFEHGEMAFLTALLEEQGRWPAPRGWPADPALKARLDGPQ